MRCEDFKEEEEATYKNMIILSSRFISEKVKTDVQITTLTFIQSQNIMIIADANIYEIWIRHILQFRVIKNLSSIIVIDVLFFDLHWKRDICSQMSFDMWTNILKEDLQYINLDIINYDFDYTTSKITENKKFCAVIIDVRCRRLLYADFEVVFEVKDCKSKCLLNSSILLNNSLLVLCQSVSLKHIIESSQTENIKNIIIFNAHKHSSNQSKHLKTDRQEQKMICLCVSDKKL